MSTKIISQAKGIQTALAACIDKFLDELLTTTACEATAFCDVLKLNAQIADWVKVELKYCQISSVETAKLTQSLSKATAAVVQWISFYAAAMTDKSLAETFQRMDESRRQDKEHRMWVELDTDHWGDLPPQAADINAELLSSLRAHPTKVPAPNGVIYTYDISKAICMSLIKAFLLTIHRAFFLWNGSVAPSGRDYEWFLDNLHSTPTVLELPTQISVQTKMMTQIIGRGPALNEGEKLVPIPSEWVDTLRSSESSANLCSLCPLDAYNFEPSALRLSASVVLVRPQLYEELWEVYGGMKTCIVEYSFVIEDQKAVVFSLRHEVIKFRFGQDTDELSTSISSNMTETVGEAALRALSDDKLPQTSLSRSLSLRWRRRVAKDIEGRSHSRLVWKHDWRQVKPDQPLRCIEKPIFSIALRTALHIPGRCGLTNIGNTCYMNSALQCLSNTEAFRQAVMRLSDQELKAAPVTAQFQELLKQMWSGEFSSVAPTEFKKAFAQTVRRFAGWEQQDSFEFINALLDTVLEELNPVKNKSYIERDADRDKQNSDQANADFYWEDFSRNNKGFVFDLFYGQMRSHLRCSVCGHSECAYDGFSCVPVPIESVHRVPMDVDVIVQDERKLAISMRLRLPKSGNSTDLLNELERALKSVSTTSFQGALTVRDQHGNRIPVSQHHMVLTETYWKNTRMITHCTALFHDSNTTYTVHVVPQHGSDSSDSPSPPEGVHTDLICTSLVKVTSQTGQEGYLVLRIPVSSTCKEIWDAIEAIIRPFVTEPLTIKTITMDGHYSLNHADDVTPIRKTTQHSFAVFLSSGELDCVLADDLTKRTIPGRNEAAPPHKPLTTCLAAMTTPQLLTGIDQWYCSNCKRHTDTEKKDTIYVLPRYIIIQLKRFTASADGYTMQKIDSAVPFEENIDMAPYVSDRLREQGETLYRLYAVVHHSGSLQHGHYVATALSPEQAPRRTVGDSSDSDEKVRDAEHSCIDGSEVPRVWVEYNDASCRPVGGGPEKTTAYILFYEKV